MPQAYTTLRTNALNILQDAGSTLFSTAELDLIMSDSLREVAGIIPYIVRVPFTLESRTGNASTTSAGNLVDTVEGQFGSGDVGKVVYNQTQKKWAVISSFSSTAQVGLSKDIFSINDHYKIFNKDCSNNKQINISDVTDYIEVLKAEYPLGTPRNITPIDSDIVELDMNRQPDDSKTLASTENQPETEVKIHFAKRHKVSQLTDFAGLLAASCAAAATTIAASALQTAGTIEADQEFTIANVHGRYWTTTAIAATASTASLTFYPPLESAIASTGIVITFKQSTLTPAMEPPFCGYVAGKAAVSKSMTYYLQLNTSITTIAAATTAIAAVAARLSAATVYVATGSTEIAKADAIILTAASSLVSITARLQAGTTYIAAGTIEIAKASANILSAATALAAMSALVTAATTYMASATTAASTIPGILNAATTELAKVATNLNAATTAIAAGTVQIALMPAVVLTAATALSAMSTRVASATTYIAAGTTEAYKAVTYITAATAEVALINAQIDLAASALVSGTALINTVPIGGGAGEWMGQAQSDFGVGRGYLTSGQGYLQSADSEYKIASGYQDAAGRELSAAAVRLSEASGFLSQARLDSDVNTAWLNSAASQINISRGYISEVQGFFQQANAESNLAGTYIQLANTQLRMASERLSEAQGDIQQANANISLNNGYLNSAAHEVQVGGGYLAQAGGYFRQSDANLSLNNSYIQLARAELAGADSKMNEANSNMRLVNTRLAVAAGGRTLEAWGRAKIFEATRELQSIRGVRKSTQYARE